MNRMKHGVGSGSSSLWELMGNAMVMTQFVRLTPDIQSKQGAVWNRVVLLDIDGKHEWRDCLDIPGVHLPRGYFFGISSVTGDLSVETPMEPLSGLALFLIVFFSLVAIVFAIVIGVIVYNKWQEQSRKHFY
ncbi:Lectin mannose binding 2 like [Crotalus adamanteus]|uniref:Lectin mannose binding 2 like n=1 Tax=Crotalus adamanteus TaxID=8729 RepID=A0AAW1B1A4_CROAD